MLLLENSLRRKKPLSDATRASLIAVNVLLYFVFCFYGIARLPLIDPDEPRYATAGRTMAEGGALLIPEFNGEPRINKPPMFYWLVAFSMKVTSNFSEAGARLPSVVAGLAMLLFTVYLGMKLFDDRTAIAAGFILSTLPLFMGLSRTCITDMSLALFLTLALGLLLLGQSGFIAPVWSVGWASVFLAMGFMTKATPALSVLGVILMNFILKCPVERRPSIVRYWKQIGFLLCVVSLISIYSTKSGSSVHFLSKILQYGVTLSGVGLIGVALICTFREPGNFWRQSHWPIWLALALLMGLWWYVYLISQFGFDQFVALLSFEVSGRLVGDIHREGFHYYFLLLPAMCFPWCLVFPGIHLMFSKHHGSRELPLRFLAAWILGIILFFSFPGAKLATYVMPLFPAVALLTAYFIFNGLPSVSEGARQRSIIAVWSSVFSAIPLLAGILLSVASTITLPMERGVLLAASTVVGVSVACAVSAWARGLSVLSTTVLTVGILITFTLIADPTIEALSQRSNKAQAERLITRAKSAERIYFKGINEESWIFYLKRSLTNLAESQKQPVRPATLLALRSKKKVWVLLGKQYSKHVFAVDFLEFLRSNACSMEVLESGQILIILNPMKTPSNEQGFQ